MNTIINRLKGNFVVLDMGSSSAVHNAFINKISNCITLLEIDAIEPDLSVNQDKFHQRIILKTAISDKKGVSSFFRRNYFPCSSFLAVDQAIVADYGMNDIYKTVETIELNCTTVNELLEQENIQRIDFFKTDLEGLDFPVIRSSEKIISSCLALQLESRFQPIYDGEPYFYEVCSYMNSMGFELVHLKPEFWKYDTKNNRYWRDGRLVWGDFIFFMKEDKLKEISGKDLPDMVLKQVLIAKTLDLNSYAEHLFEKYSSIFNNEIRQELENIVTPQKTAKYRMLSFMAKVSSNSLFRTIRRYVWKLYSAMYVDKQSKWMVK